MPAARILFVASQTLTMLLGALGLGVAFISLFTNLNAFADYVPVEMIQATGVISAFVLMVSLVGLSMVVCRLDECFILFMVMSTVQVLFNLGFFIVMVLFSQGKETLPVFDGLLNDTFTNFEANVVEIALADQPAFIDVQDRLGCCGVSFEETFENDAVQLATMTGNKCDEVTDFNGVPTSAVDIFDQIEANNPGDLQGALNEAAATILGENNFFCEEELKQLAEDILSALNVIFAFVIAFELISLLCSCLIYCCIPRDDEGHYDFEADNKMEQALKDFSNHARQPFISFRARISGSNSGRWMGPPKMPESDLKSEHSEDDDELTIHNELQEAKPKQAAHSFKGVLSMIAPFSFRRSSNMLRGPMVTGAPAVPPKIPKSPKPASYEGGDDIPEF